ncbi:MAG TPA: prolyl aminopeptidase [Gammaproteobacteria bacterium]|nr:prolyl aminopeptidase [Gammaproteobacteria bacterium]
MLTFYPPIKPYAEHNLKVDDLHTIFIEECGEPTGIPVLFLHGGPGVGCIPDNRRFFDPTRYRIILSDQRGCGRSTPHICLINNTTQDLVADMEKIREFLNVKKWMLFGGSWGATLALLYAQQHPNNVLAMVLRGVFLARKQELDWLFKPGGASKFFPDHWQKFLENVPEDSHDNLIKAYYDLLHGQDEVRHMAVAKAWGLWEAECSTLDVNPDIEKRFTNAHFALGVAAIETHYFINNCFIEENQILNNMAKISHLPGVVVHGRYDMVCTLDNSYALSALWPEAKLEIIRHAGHAAAEPAITDALILATNALAV